VAASSSITSMWFSIAIRSTPNTLCDIQCKGTCCQSVVCLNRGESVSFETVMLCSLAKPHVATRAHQLLQVQDPRLLDGTQVRTRRVAQAGYVQEVHASVVVQYFRHIYSARANKAGLEALRFKFADFDPRPYGVRARESGSVIGADRDGLDPLVGCRKACHKAKWRPRAPRGRQRRCTYRPSVVY